jgi:hypothetical protein
VPPNNENQTPKKTDKSRFFDIVERILRGLQHRPGYILVFGVCFIALMAGSLWGAAGYFNDAKSKSGVWPGAILAMVAVVGTIIAVIKLESAGSSFVGGKVGNTEMQPTFERIHRNIAEALRFQHPVFHDWMITECDTFLNATASWASGELVTNQRRYVELLLEIYSRAEKNIVAITTEDFFSIWKSKMGEKVLKVNGQTGKQVERIFTFASIGSVKIEHLAEMDRHAATKNVLVRVWINEEDPAFNIPADINPNIAFIDDGNVIASSSLAPNGLDVLGTFHFKHDDRRKRYSDIIDKLREGGWELAKFKVEKLGHPPMIDKTV